MHYYIDGYNLMFRSHYVEGDLQKQREQIIQSLNEKVQHTKIDATLVFDAYYQYGEGSRSHYNYLEIVFTDEGETADDWIIKQLRQAKKPREEVVVTSDKKLAWRARLVLAKAESVEEFLTWLNKRYTKSVKKEKQERYPKPSRETKKTLKSLSLEKIPKKNPEANFEYYLYHFEKRLAELVNKERPSSKEIPKEESDFKRWLRLFEERQDENLE